VRFLTPALRVENVCPIAIADTPFAAFDRLNGVNVAGAFASKGTCRISLR
jgi:hypothetical protein